MWFRDFIARFEVALILAHPPTVTPSDGVGSGAEGAKVKGAMPGVHAQRLSLILVDPLREEADRTRALLDRSRFFHTSLTWVKTMDAAIERLELGSFDAIFLSVYHGDNESWEPLADGTVRSMNVPVIVLSDQVDETLSVKAVAWGAQDYLAKEGLDTGSLDRTVRYAVERHRLVSELRELSLIDPLTGLYNRRAFDTLARQQLKLAERSSHRLLVFFVDLDNLKWINDNLGHPSGDRTLIDAARIFRQTFRDADLVARLGGDEFAVLATESSDGGAEAVIDRLRKQIDQFNTDPSNPVGISMSVGVTYYEPHDPCSLETLIERADRMMYEEKRRKRAARPQGEASGNKPA
jgi:diguanylate cyclase (GGDEF)-like protein